MYILVLFLALTMKKMNKVVILAFKEFTVYFREREAKAVQGETG